MPIGTGQDTSSNIGSICSYPTSRHPFTPLPADPAQVNREMAKTALSLALLLLCIIFAPADSFVGACGGTPSRSRLCRVGLGAEVFGAAKGQMTISKNAVMSFSAVRGGITRNRKIGSMPILHRALEGYLDNLEKRPILTKGISSGIIAGIGNFIQQSLSNVAFSLTDWTAFTLVGTVYIGTLLHLWFNFLDRLAHSKVVSSRVRSKWGRTMLQVGVDVTLGTAMVNTGVFVINTILIAALTGRLSPLPDLWSAVKLKVSSNFWPMMIENLKIWPWVGFLNFAYVPVKFRVLVTNCVAVFWSYLLSQWCG